MSRIIPIPTTRVGDFFVHQRLTEQVQFDQVALFRLQNQISTGRRLQLPSDDAPAALRAINLQLLLARKGQIRSNLQASNFYLATAEANLDSISTSLASLRADALSVADTLSTDSQRQAVIQSLDEVLRGLVNVGNAKSQGRYLFAGSRAQAQPYAFHGQYVEYLGNQGALRSYVDLERLFDTNVTGPQVFGGISSGIEGGDLNPHVTRSTLLSTVNGGTGIGRNPAIALSVTTGAATVTSLINLAGAVTVGDVARLIEAGAPPGTSVSVDVTGTGLVLRAGDGSTVSVGEVADGRTARALGLPVNTPPSQTLVGDDLDPSVTKTTRLADLLGTKAQGRIESNGANNDILIAAAKNGADFNDVTVVFVGGGSVGSEIVTYDDSDPANKTLTVQVQPGASTAAHVAAAITAHGTFLAEVDRRDALSPSQAGTGAVEIKNFGALTTGGSGDVLDTESGLVLTNGGSTVSLDISGAKTVEDLLNLINGAGLGLLAEINSAANAIQVRSRLSGADFTIGANGGTTATQLGIRTFTGQTPLSALNRGLGVPTSSKPEDDDFVITARDGTQLAINLTAAGSESSTIQDVIDLINSTAATFGNPPPIEARLALVGNGIELVDQTTGPLGTETLTVSTVEGSLAAQYLGFVSKGQTQSDSSRVTDEGANQVLKSDDRHTLEADGVFNTLLRLRRALEEADVTEIGRSLERLDADMTRVNFARAEIGARLQNLELVGIRLEDENVQLRSALSQEIDVDLIEAISNLTARQYAFEASLRSAGNLMRLSLLNFI